MGNEKFTWVVKDFDSVIKDLFYSEDFVIGGCRWILAGVVQKADYFALFLVIADCETLPSGSKRHIKYRLTVVNQHFDRLSQHQEAEVWLDRELPIDGTLEMISIAKLISKEDGFLVNNQVKIVAEVEVLEVIGELDVLEESQPLKRIKLNESIDVNGFQVLPSQVESVKRIFERHPDMALQFRAKNQNLRKSCINVLLDLIETMCLSLQDLSIDDLGQAEKALTYLKDSGLKVGWLERKLEEVKEKKMEAHIRETRMHKVEEELKVFKQKFSDKEAQLEKDKEELKDLQQICSDIEAFLEKEKANVLAAARAPPLTLDDVV